MKLLDVLGHAFQGKIVCILVQQRLKGEKEYVWLLGERHTKLDAINATDGEGRVPRQAVAIASYLDHGMGQI